MSGFDEPSEFELLLGELERAAESLGPADESLQADSEESTGALDLEGRPLTLLRERPKSLVDLRALSFDDPLSHQFTLPVEVTDVIDVGTVIDNKYEVLGGAPRSTDGWEARHVVLRQRFILQPLARSIVDDPIMWPKFRSDIRSAGLLGHENIEFVTDLGKCPQFGPYLIKQWIEGPSLEEFLEQRGTQSPRDAVSFAHAVGGALAALHEIGIIHGRLSGGSVCRVEMQGSSVWKLLDVCIPGGDEVLLAPEQQRGEGSGPEADQYAVALLTWRLMLGASAKRSTPADSVPGALVEVLQRAMEDMPLMRWPDMDAFVSELLESLPANPTPQVHPFDRREASRHVQQQLERSEQSPDEQPAPAGPSNAFERPRSMLIKVRDAVAKPEVVVAFNTGARLRREFRRNMIAGGLFIPTADDLSVGGTVKVCLDFVPRGARTEVPASIVNFDPGGPDRPRGYGVAFDPASRGRIKDFVRELGLGLGLSPSDELRALKELDARANIDAGGAFLLSRLRGTMSVGSARAMFSGLPFDFEQTLESLIDGGFVEVVSKDKPEDAASRQNRSRERTRRPYRPTPASSGPGTTVAPPARAEPTPPPKPEPARRAVKFSGHEWADTERVLESVAYFEEQGNFMAAGRMLESAAENAPQVAVYQHRLALLRARFDLDLAAARKAIQRARTLAPDNQEFRSSERYIETLIEMSAVRVAWEHEYRPGAVRWLRTEPALARTWLAARGANNSLISVDYRTGSVDVTERGGAEWVCVPENAPEFDPLEHRKPVPFTSASSRRDRQIELHRRFGGMGPHFVREPAAARSVNSIVRAVVDADGLVVARQGGAPLQLGSGDIRQVEFSPDDQYLTWSERRSANRWAVFVAPVTGPAREAGIFEGEPVLRWSDDANYVIGLDTGRPAIMQIERRNAKTKMLYDARGTIEPCLCRSTDDKTLLLAGRKVVGGVRNLAVWLSMRGDVIGDFSLPGTVTAGIVRPDGKLAARLKSGELVIADLKNATVTTIDSVRPDGPSVAGSQWAVGEPLVVVEIIDGNARVRSIDVDLICG